MSRVEDPRLLTGQGRYVADISRPGELHAVFLRGAHAHARILNVDVEAARHAPGVAAVFVAADIENARPMPAMHVPNPGFAKSVNLIIRDAPANLLAADRLRYVGEPLAVLVADSRAAAEDALGLIDVEVEPLEPVTGLGAGPDLWDEIPGNLAGSLRLRRELPRADMPHPEDAGSPDQMEETITVRGHFHIGRHGGAPIETRGVVAEPDPGSGRLTVWTSTQVPHRVRLAISESLGWNEERVRVITPDVGGAFGTKATTYPEEALVAYCAAALGRTVRWVEDRSEHFLAAAQSRDQVHDVELEVDGQGRILRFQDDYSVDLGACSLWTAGITCNTALHALGPYRMPVADISGRGLFGNKAPSAQYRGAGRPEACFALERALDKAARRLGIDGFEIRRRNLIQPDEMPYQQHVLQRDGVPVVYEASDYPAILAKALELAAPESWPELRREVEAAGERLGTGCAAYVEATGRGPFEGARVSVEQGGRIAIFTGAASAGQGHQTTLARVCSRVLDVPLENITVTGGDTDLMPRGVGTFASRTAVVAGNAVHQASLDVREQLLAHAADKLRVPPTELRWLRGCATAPDGSSIGIAELGQAQAESYFQPDTVTWTMGVHVAVVAVQPETGGVRILRYASVHDGGEALDATIVEGQMHGGIAQGIGGALFEESVYDEDGQPSALTMADYLLPTSMDIPDVQVGHTTAAANNPLGIKGVGESGTVPAAAALANAISDALDGAPIDETPITPERVWRAARR